jgi:hypothetical protein
MNDTQLNQSLTVAIPNDFQSQNLVGRNHGTQQYIGKNGTRLISLFLVFGIHK